MGPSRTAPENTLHRKLEAFQEAVPLKGYQPILGTGRNKPAACRQ